ncbi:hypothetical protein OU994_27290 [Pseudoduganella sp. SL102]|uniref:hypothetical protein n=1 Tax=Pseudoduganella sp. SL102 TaxID=2995154 RepID=UPI00248C7A31|nr:hypothetical protein [Pseudoduganella sp. SL102]WBS01923.1 hypothetical protein OU994_27290 [Pseudoduganella sp. SL102]
MDTKNRTSKSSHLPALAGTLAGLLAAALGAWYLYPQHVGPGTGPARVPVAAPATASPASPTASAPAPAAASVAATQPGQPLTSEQAVARLMALPELQAWAQRIEKASGGAVRGAVIPFDPAPRTVNGRQYHQLSFVENRPEAAVTWQSFLVGVADGEILVDDDESLLPLARWRTEQRPMERAAR